MAGTQVQWRKGTTVQHSTFTGAEGEVTVDTTKDTAVVHDGTTAGGRALLREDLNNLANSTIGTAKLSFDSGAFGFRNKIIGGDFTTNPWQRGTTITAPTSVQYLADRFVYSLSGTGVINVLKTADAPTAAQAGVYTQHCLHVDVTTADAAMAATDLYSLQQAIEGLNAVSFGFGQSGTRYVTLSFWHKHTKTGVYCVSLSNSAADRSYVAEYMQDVTDTWEKASITVPVDTSGTWLYDTGIGLRVRFTIATGSNFQTTANTWASGNFHATANQVNALDNVVNNFKIALVQLEAGQTATPFETRSVGQELALCQRYYQRISPAANSSNLALAGFPNSTTVAVLSSILPVKLRIAPTALEQSGTAGDYAVNTGGGAVACSSVPTHATASNEYAVQVAFSVASGLTVGQAVTARTGATTGTTAYLAWSAEL